jgi:thiol:disulfide interchange protein
LGQAASVKVLLRILLACCVSLSAFGAAKTQWRLILSEETAQPGQTVWAGLEMKIPPKWHTYWRNPGDSGIATSIKWTVPNGIKPGDIQWPVPKKFTETQGDFSQTTYIYEDTTVLLIPLEITKDAPRGRIELKGRVSWQECEQLCVQGHTDVAVTLTIGASTKPSADVAVIDLWRQKLPKQTAVDATANWQAIAAGDDRPVAIEWKTDDVNADFFPYKDSGFDVGGKTELHVIGKRERPPEAIQLIKTVTKSEGDWPKSLTGVLVNEKGQGVEVNLPIKEAPVAAAPNEPLTATSLLINLGWALLAGLILNIMPCVLPIIALKVLGFVNQTREEAARVRRLSIIYMVGVLVSFAVLAAIAIAVKQAGGLADWGAAFRNPQFRFIITTVILLVALNLFGVFEITLSGRAMGTAGDLASKQGYTGAFFNGVLATVLATPCTAPFLSAAWVFAIAQPPIITVLVFLFIGIGLALPFVVLSWFPALRRFMPKPGAWMERFKVAMGFPMLATALWLFWASEKDDQLLWFGFFLVIIAFVAWIWGQFVQRGSRGRGVAIACAAIVFAANYFFILEGQLEWRLPVAKRTKGTEWKAWSKQAVEAARKDGHVVLVDFTAKTCANCRANKALAIEVPDTRAKLKQIDAVTFKADYSDEDPAIGKELQSFGRAGVPLVLVFPKDVDKPPIVLPPILTKSIVLNALDEAAGTNAPTQSASR